MNKLIDKIILIIICICISLTDKLDIMTVAGFILAVSVSALCSYFDKQSLRLWICAAFIAVCMLNKSLFMFMPVIVYESSRFEIKPAKYMWLVPVLSWLVRNEYQVSLIIILVSFLVFRLGRLSGIYEDTKSSYYILQDESKERSRFLEKRNRELIEKQDYEIKVATLTERNRIAREIHDNVGHLLTRAILQVGALDVIYQGDDDTKECISEVKKTLNDAMDNVRSSVHDLHEESIDLRINICRLIDDFSFCPVRLDFDAENPSKEIKYCFIAIIKEALSNIAKHSDASEVRISVLEHPAFYQLIINDNGTKKKKSKGDGIGLLNMRERAEALHGSFSAGFDRGFKIFVSVPKERKNEDSNN